MKNNILNSKVASLANRLSMENGTVDFRYALATIRENALAPNGVSAERFAAMVTQTSNQHREQTA